MDIVLNGTGFGRKLIKNKLRCSQQQDQVTIQTILLLKRNNQVFAALEIGNEYFGNCINKTVKLTIIYINNKQNKDNVNTTRTINNYRQTNSNNNKEKSITVPNCKFYNNTHLKLCNNTR